MRWIHSDEPDVLAPLGAKERNGLRRCVALLDANGYSVIVRRNGSNCDNYLSVRSGKLRARRPIAPVATLAGMAIRLCRGAAKPMERSRLALLLFCADMHHCLRWGKTISGACYGDPNQWVGVPNPPEFDVAIRALILSDAMQEVVTETSYRRSVSYSVREVAVDAGAVKALFTGRELNSLREVALVLRESNGLYGIARAGMVLIKERQLHDPFIGECDLVTE